MSKRVAVIGGGISGLTTAFLLRRDGIDVTLFERSDAVGGNVQTVSVDGFTIEQGPNSLLRSPAMIDLIRLLGIEDKVLPADPSAKKRYILTGNHLEAMGLKSFLNGYFSLSTILALIREPFVRSKSPEHESVAEFVSRRIGPEFLDKAIDPFVSGVYAGDPANLSMRSAFPKLYEMERDFGSLIMGTFRRKKEKVDESFPRTFSFRGGLRTLIDHLAASIGEGVRLSTPVNEIAAAQHGRIQVNAGEYDSVVISTPSYAAAELIRSRDSGLAEMLSAVNYPQVAVVIMGFKNEKIPATLDGFGFLIPSKEKRLILGTLYHSAVFPERAPDGYQLLMTFVGGVRSGDSLDNKSDEDLASLVRTELRDILGIAEEPDLIHIKRWNHAIPQYRVGYEEVTAACSRFESSFSGIYFCSNFYRGISIGDCVKNAFQTAAHVSRYLSDKNEQL
ncbi:MAG: protoporphyrinogen oxidase [Acidobacteriota bacterium]